MKQRTLRTWNLQEAKAKFSELVDLAQSGKPQVILRRGKPAAAVVSIEQYATLQPKRSLISFLLHAPPRGSQLDLSHANEPLDSRADVFENE